MATTPPSLFDTYKQYKAGTIKVTTWLASRAQELNTCTDLFAPSEIKGTGRLKGKARAAKKVVPKEQSHQIPLSAIPRIAKAIANIKAQEVPGTIIRTLEDVIAARSACNECFEEHGSKDQSTQASNEKHQHFIRVLRETLRILKPLSKGSDPMNGTNRVRENDSMEGVAGLRNLFQYLEVEDPIEWTSSTLPSDKKSSKALCRYELEPTDEDISFAIFCLLKDLTDIRHYVRQTWAEYREHRIALTTAALTMNTVISVFRRLNEEFLVNFPQFDDHGAITSKVFFCDLTYEILALFFMQAELAFYQQEAVRARGFPLSDDEEALYKCLSLFGLANTQFEGDFFTTRDQVILALHIARKDKVLYTWVVFAVQLFVDTRRILGKELKRCFDETQEVRKWMVTTLDQCLLHGQTNTVNDYHKTNAGRLQEVKKSIKLLLEYDLMQEIADEYLDARSALYAWGSFYLFRNHPMLLGLLTQYFLTKIHELRIGLGGDQAAIITSIHLYNACQQSRYLSESLEWTDLERLIELQDPSWIFVGDRPKLPGKCFSHYNLMGVSATAFSKNRHGKSTMRLNRNVSLPIAQKKNRRLKHMSTYFALMYVFNQHAKPGTARWSLTRAADDPLVMLEKLVERDLAASNDAAAGITNDSRKPLATRPKVHPLKMISILKNSLKSEEEIFRFDLVTLNQRCVEMLRKA
ncbi:hypothetical protein L207DRAFT_592660 [Hyaloscypha variabilis F]|uniref:DUF6604 domain-containing protein n=1 Tax=Hyaloscypha variabilis (strain UAMH 11265 / GT02V1 / F) TaxID=1149755 RepID=A0A2J6QVD0_HYAVF|nr:hypothetical protein L207DRAFT_592660 [Hyaloscypha variabilis F]